MHSNAGVGGPRGTAGARRIRQKQPVKQDPATDTAHVGSNDGPLSWGHQDGASPHPHASVNVSRKDFQIELHKAAFGS